MKCINSVSDYQEIRGRIQLLSSANQKKWGKMTIQQMLVHCTTQLKMAIGEISAQQQGSFLMRTAIAKWLAFSDIPWPKGASTPKEMNMDSNTYPLTDIKSEKSELLSYLSKVKEAKELSTHPFFGSLSQKEWGTLIYIHIDNHLQQFSQ